MVGAQLWDQPAIQAEIRRRGSSVAELSRNNGLKGGTLYSAFYKRWPKGQKLIADYIGKPVEELWPHWYGPGGTLKPLQGVQQRPAA